MEMFVLIIGIRKVLSRVTYKTNGRKIETKKQDVRRTRRQIRRSTKFINHSVT